MHCRRTELRDTIFSTTVGERVRETRAQHTLYMHNVHSDNNMVVVIDNTHAQGESTRIGLFPQEFN